nr:toll/interleukin-1 receptor domain-containing protein [Caldimonas sp.]
MGEPRIFISYRRDDAAGYARAVNDVLARRFGADAVFIDVDDIHAGAPFSEVIQRSVGGSAVLLALIGKRWLGEREGAPPRIRDDADFVRREVAAGLANPAMRVVPVLLDGAAMPQAAQLPPDLRELAGRNALELDNTRFAADTDRLLREVEEALGEGPSAPATRTSFALRWLAVAALAALVVAAAVYELRSSLSAAKPAASSARAAVNGEWRAQVEYDWPGARHVERFVFAGQGDALHGSASFLGVARGVLEGAVEGEQLRFVTRTGELGGGDASVVHRYRGQLVGDELRFVMQTEGGGSAHVPVEFVARRAAASAPAANR